MTQPELFPDPVPVRQGPALPAWPESDAARFDLLGMSLDLAVPMWVERRSSWTWNQRLVRGRQIVDLLGVDGAYILYASKKKGQSAQAFNALAEGIAMLSFHWGGVSLFGRHWHTPSCYLCGALQNLTEPLTSNKPPRCVGGGCEKRQRCAQQANTLDFFRAWCDTLVCIRVLGPWDSGWTGK